MGLQNTMKELSFPTIMFTAIISSNLNYLDPLFSDETHVTGASLQSRDHKSLYHLSSSTAVMSTETSTVSYCGKYFIPKQL